MCATYGNEGRVGNSQPVEDDIAALYTLDASQGAKGLNNFPMCFSIDWLLLNHCMTLI